MTTDTDKRAKAPTCAHDGKSLSEYAGENPFKVGRLVCECGCSYADGIRVTECGAA